jgi:hypothetical protein
VLVSVWFANRFFTRERCLAVLLCAPLMHCVGEVRKSTLQDAAQEQPGDGSDASAEPGPGGELPDATVAVDSARPPDNGTDARVTSSPEAGPAPDARASTDSGTPDARVSQPDTGTPSANTKGVFVAVGYSGVRMLSRDGGKTWGDIKMSGGSGDDGNLLRAVSFGDGMFVAAGWKIWTSTDGANWTERANPANQWMGGLEFGNGIFVGAGGNGTSIYSMDGTQWMAGNDRNSEAARTVAFGNGMFVAATDARKWWSTTDGKAWTVMAENKATNQVMWCKDKFAVTQDCTEASARSNGHTAYGDGVWISASGSKIERSEDDGKTWTSVKDTSGSPVEDVAFGYVAE